MLPGIGLIKGPRNGGGAWYVNNVLMYLINVLDNITKAAFDFAAFSKMFTVASS
jgi:hypothetical protein